MTVDLVVTGVGVVDPAAGFDYKVELGKRGYKYLPSASQYLLAATKRAVADAGDALATVPEESRAAAVGTNCAASALHAQMDRTVIDADANDLSPATAPYFSINLFGSRLATEHALKGFNLTVTSPRVAGLEAVQAGGRSIALGRAGWLVAGAAEEALDPAEPGADTAETGAVAIVFEPAAAVAARGGRVLGRCVVRTAFLAPTGLTPDLVAGVIGPVRAWAGDVPVRAVVDSSPVGEALAAAFGPDTTVVRAGAGCLRPMAEVAAVLAAGERALVVTAAAQGNVAFALVTPGGN
ncbi:beta-ketoacyl synthase N-terminal-like domain-containing protein [Actinokineospora inagensis]|uniref:beta-ketoacyl synthase N-terminal-like domain-containing protein n=1 Tax=Actinokineospora inagensis TaxID=103730 RepID=UPI0004041B3E|nr:beta-ketoacyl synthase N-terminal-like domain-containing protein [Actinokineospora inagensis]